MNELDRTVSIGTNAASIAALHHDGHTEGHLNCLAIRHGWTRKFSVPPDVLENFSYTILEQILELHTLKLRSTHLRVYVENPPSSGTWSKIRYWKDDGSLQSVLVQQFFQGRLHTDGGGPVGSDAHAHVKLEVRDGHDREDAMSVRSGIVGVGTAGGSRINLTVRGSLKGRPEWLRKRREGTVMSGPDDDTGEIPPPPQAAPSRFEALKFLVGLSSAPVVVAASQPKTEEELAAEAKAEEDALRKRGWLPPRLRRMASRRSNASKANKGKKGRSVDAGTEYETDVADDTAVEPVDETTGLVSGKDKEKSPGRWLRFGSKPAEVPKGKGKQLNGAQVVGKPSDAFADGPATTAATSA